IGQNPLFQVWFFLDNAASRNDPVLPEITTSLMKNDFSPAKLDLALSMTVYPDSIVGTFTYAADLFEPGSITMLAKRFQFLLQALVGNPDCKLFDIPFIGSIENRQLMETYPVSHVDEKRPSFLF